ncbi:MAG: ATP-binding protein [Succinivibrionaceae bacterium]|nr:ATP-binding protein [Succinivibrionaceae bacterium]
MARNQGYLVSYIAKLSEYCDVLLLKGAYHIGIDEIVRNINDGKINYINLASPIVKSRIKDNPDAFVKHLDKRRINVLNNIQCLPEIIQYLQSLYSNLKSKGSTSELKTIIGTCAEIPELEDLNLLLAEKMFTSNLYPSSVAEATGYSANILDKLYAKTLHRDVYARTRLHEMVKSATFVKFSPDNPDYFDELLNLILNQNIGALYHLNSPSKAVKIMIGLANYIGRETLHERICMDTDLDDITYPSYYQSILDSFVGFELRPYSPPSENDSGDPPCDEDLEQEEYETRRFYFIDCNFLAYLKGKTINRRIFGDFILFYQILTNFVISELKKISSAQAGAELWYIHRPDCEIDVMLTREGNNAIGFRIRGNDQILEKDLKHFGVFRQIMGPRFKRGYVIYLGNEIRKLDEDVYALPISYLWSDYETRLGEFDDDQEASREDAQAV